MDALEGMLVLQVAQGVGRVPARPPPCARAPLSTGSAPLCRQTLFLVDEKESARLAALPVYEAPEARAPRAPTAACIVTAR